MNCQGLLLTYQSFRTAAVWPAFKAWVRAEAQSWRARYHGATMEFNDPARAGPGDVRHLHLMLRFREKVGFVLFQRPPGGGGGGGGIALCGTGRGSSGAAKKRSPFEKVGPPVLGTFARGAHQGRWDRREGGRGPLANSQNCPPRRAGSPTPPGPSWKGRRVSFRTGLKCPACHAGAHPRGPHERREVDVSSDQFAFPWGDRRILPNLRPDWSDLLGERFSGRYLDDALARGFFYVPGGGSLFFSVLCLAPRPPPRPPRHLVKATHP